MGPSSYRTHRPRRLWELRLWSLWEHRGLGVHLGWAFVRKRFVGAWLGWLWIPVRPTFDILLRTLVFGGFLGVSSGDRPYILYLGVGMAAWMFFDVGGLWAYRSLQLHRRYFRQFELPWLSPVVGAAVPGAVEGALYGLITLIAALYYLLVDGTTYLHLTEDSLLVPIGFLVLLLYVWIAGLLMAPLVAKARDLRYLMRYAFGVLYFVTPVLYPVTELPEKYRNVIELNPLTAPIAWVQNGLLGTGLPAPRSVAVSLLTIAMLLPLGMFLFARQEAANHAQL